MLPGLRHGVKLGDVYLHKVFDAFLEHPGGEELGMMKKAGEGLADDGLARELDTMGLGNTMEGVKTLGELVTDENLKTSILEDGELLPN